MMLYDFTLSQWQKNVGDTCLSLIVTWSNPTKKAEINLHAPLKSYASTICKVDVK